MTGATTSFSWTQLDEHEMHDAPHGAEMREQQQRVMMQLPELCGEEGELRMRSLYVRLAAAGGEGGGEGYATKYMVESERARMQPRAFLHLLVDMGILQARGGGASQFGGRPVGDNGLLSRQEVFEVFDQACQHAMIHGDEGRGVSWPLFRLCLRGLCARLVGNYARVSPPALLS